MMEKARGSASMRKVPSSEVEAGGMLQSASNILARRLSGTEVKVVLVVSKMVPPTFKRIQSDILN